MAIDAIGGALTSLGSSTGLTQPASGAGLRFTQALGRLIDESDEAGKQANTKVAAMLDGSGDVHDAMVALQRADISVQLTVQVRNKLMNAYQEIMRMPI
jgi:flagellar hook-basal body complex protein FliE